jgi:hypothetical protein
VVVVVREQVRVHAKWRGLRVCCVKERATFEDKRAERVQRLEGKMVCA